MKKRPSEHRRISSAAALAASVLLVLAAVPSHAVLPEGKHYLVALLLLDPDDRQPDSELRCLRFLPNQELCDVLADGSEVCGTWQFDELRGRQNRWHGEMDAHIDGVLVRVEFNGQTERAGFKSSIGGTVYVSGFNLNAGFAGVQLRRALCRDLAATDD